MKKILCLILAIVMTVFVFASCDNTEATSRPSGTSNGDNSDNSSAELFSGLREWDGGDGDFLFLVGGMQYGERYQSREIGAEETDNTLINDAVYNRNSLVEERFNIDIKAYATEASENIDTIISNLANTNTYTYDVVMPIMNNMVSGAAMNYYYDLFDAEISADLDLTKEWWDQKAVSDLSLGGKLYFTTGYMSILDNECTQALVFNKTLVTDNELESPYTLVKSGDWTYDKMNELATAITRDSDGVNGMTSADTYGIWFNENSGQGLFIAAGGRLILKNDADYPEIVITSGNSASIVDKMATFIAGNPNVQIIERANIAGTGARDVYYYATEAVATGRALFRQMALVDIYELSEYECSYGILPLPKYDTEQDNYYSVVSTVLVPGIAIPTNNPNPENAALVLAAMGEASTDTLNHAYYETLLKDRKVVDNESGEMLDIIFNNRVYDLGVVFAWGYINSTFAIGNAIAANGTSTFASYWQGISSSVEAAMNTTIESFMNQ